MSLIRVLGIIQVDSNFTSRIGGNLRVRIREIVNNEKYDDYKYKENIMRRMSDATDEFKSFIDQED